MTTSKNTSPRPTALKLTLASSLFALVAACGGGDEVASAPAAGPAPAPAPAPPSGQQAWAGQVQIPTAAGNPGSSQIDLAANGNAVAVWVQASNNVNSIWASTYTPAGGWGTAMLLENSDIGDAASPDVKWDSAGNAMAIWQQYDGTYTNIYSARYTPAGGWAGPALVEDLVVPNAGIPQIAMDPAGNAVAAWVAGSGQADAWANRYTPGTGWGTPQMLEFDNTGNVTRIRVAVDSDGSALAVWSQAISGRGRIRASRYTAAGGWGGATAVEDNASGSGSEVQVAFDGQHNALAVWRHNNNGPISQVQANSYSPGSGWSTLNVVEPSPAGHSRDPQLAIAPDGNAVAVWWQSTSTRANVWASSYAPATGWLAAPVLLEQEDNFEAQNPQVAMDANGNATAVWIQTASNPTYNLWKAHYTVAGGWAAGSLAETDDSAITLDPLVHVAPNGTTVIGWRYFISGVSNTLWTRFFQ
jgi:hypothetical protein